MDNLTKKIVGLSTSTIIVRVRALHLTVSALSYLLFVNPVISVFVICGGGVVGVVVEVVAVVVLAIEVVLVVVVVEVP